MTYATLISVTDLRNNISASDWAIIDCRFSLSDPDWGRSEYLNSHVPGAIYAHLDEDLSGPIIPGKTGRHPLPTQNRIASVFSSWGIHSGTQVVAYDDAGGSIASRLWWMLKWQGHDSAAVLDGGWPAWTAANRPVTKGPDSRTPAAFAPNPRPEMIANLQEVEGIAAGGSHLLVDSRAADRFRGENETIDPIAGHIPGAVNFHYAITTDEQGQLIPRDELKQHYLRLLAGRKPEEIVFYCGSGVSAGQNLLAMEAAGLPGARLYPGSWSEWIIDPGHAIRTGSDEKEN